MALINNLYVFVEDESVVLDAETTSHPVEEGIDITDHVQRKPVELSISGKIVDHGDTKASDILAKLKALQKSGSLIYYLGRNSMTNMQIQSFSTSHPYTIWGGCDFSMILKEVRIAKPAYVEKVTDTSVTNAGTQQVQKGENEKVYHNVKKGDTVWVLVTTKYKSLEPKYSNTMQKCQWIMNQNPNAFSRKGDFGTLQIGKKILVGTRK